MAVKFQLAADGDAVLAEGDAAPQRLQHAGGSMDVFGEGAAADERLPLAQRRRNQQAVEVGFGDGGIQLHSGLAAGSEILPICGRGDLIG